MKRSIAPLVAGGATSALLLLVVYFTPWYAGVRERAFDAVTARLSSIPEDAHPIVVDIDRTTLEGRRMSRLSRGVLAELIEAIAAAKPHAIVVDVLIEGADASSPASHARSLAAATGDARVAELAATLPDDDQRLAGALKRAPSVLGLALDPGGTKPTIATTPILARGSPDPRGWWTAPGIIAPPSALAASAAGKGLLALPGDDDGAVRRVPLVAVGGKRIIPGLAVDAIRVAEGASTLIVSAEPPALVAGKRAIPLGQDGMLRLVASAEQVIAQRTMSAATFEPQRLDRRIVVVGTSAPEFGGLRTASGGRLMASVQLQADAIAQLKAGVIPKRWASLVMAEAALLALASGLAIWAALKLPPVAGAVLSVVAGLAWSGAAAGAFGHAHALIDPIAGPVTMIAAFAATAIAAFADTRRRAQAIQRRFEQHLAPAVVQQILANPNALKLDGERRRITCLFTDIEGFTAMTERSEPEAVVAVLDRYLDGVGSIVVAHGGMVDKFVGDAVHAIFNAPLDVPDHGRRALHCAREILAFSERMRADPQASHLGLGRTRIGIETGPAIVGDVGGGGKLDYTAHGNVINTAARLEALNKDFLSSICIGPGAAADITDEELMPLGKVALRGRSEPQPVFSIWPEGLTDTDRHTYVSAIALIESDPARARAMLASTSDALRASPLVQALRDRLAAAAADSEAINRRVL